MSTPIIIDTDMAIDDWLAILYLLRHPEADVRLITVAAAGEAHAGPGEVNARRLLALAGHPGIPTAAGSPLPMHGKRAFPLIVRLLMDARLFLPMPGPSAPVVSGKTAVELIASTLEASTEPVSILALGPLTNLAEVLQSNPKLAKKIAAITIMGGALDVPGNLGSVSPGLKANVTAEWNIYIDPHAANIVFKCGAPVILVPLDATNLVPLTKRFLTEIAARAQHPAAKFSYKALERIFRLSNGREFYFWDPLAAAAVVQADILKLEEFRLRVIEEDGTECGRVLRDDQGFVVQAAIGADAQAFEQSYLEVLGRS